VEQKSQIPALTVSLPEVNELYSDFYTKAVICRFNGFWPKSDALHQWIFSTWTPNCQIHLCSKGYFIVRFGTVKDKEYAFNEGPWFWGNAGLFMIPWFPGFDATTMLVSKIPVWVRLHNLPLHFWHHKVLEGIGNSLGKFLKIDANRLTRDLFTFARICVKVDLSQGLPDCIILIHNNVQWTQPLVYEDTAFRCHGCLQTGHLHSACPQAKKDPKRNKKQFKKPKGWQCTKPLEEEVDEEETTENNAEKDVQNVHNNSQNDEIELSSACIMRPNNPSQQHETHTLGMEVSGSKQTHGSEGSDFDKEYQTNSKENQMSTVTSTPNIGGW